MIMCLFCPSPTPLSACCSDRINCGFQTMKGGGLVAFSINLQNDKSLPFSFRNMEENTVLRCL